MNEVQQRAEHRTIRVFERELFARVAHLRAQGWDVLAVEPEQPTVQEALRALARSDAHQPVFRFRVELARGTGEVARDPAFLRWRSAHQHAPTLRSRLLAALADSLLIAESWTRRARLRIGGEREPGSAI
jgi:hypothetical protein